MTTIDHMAASAVRWLDAQVDPVVDVDGGLERLRHGGASVSALPAARARVGRRWMALAGAAVLVVVAGGAAIALMGRDHDGGQLVPDGSVTAPVDTAAPATTVTATNVPATTVAPTTTGSPSTTVAPTTTTVTRVVDISGPWPTFDPADAAPTPYLVPDDVLADLTMQRRTEWSGDLVVDQYDQWFVSPDGGAVLRISTTASSAPQAPSGPLIIGGWRATPQAMAPGFAAIVLSAEAGTVELWATGIDEQALEATAATLSRAATGRPGWDAQLPAGVRSWTEGWYRPDQGHGLQWLDANGARRAELREGCCVFEGRGWPQDPTPVVYDGTLVVTESSPGMIEAAWVQPTTDGGATPVLVRIVDGDLADVSAIVRSMHSVEDAGWQTIAPEPPLQDDGCDSLFC